MELLIKTRAKLIGSVYRNFLKKILFSFDPERVHNRFVNFGDVLGKTNLGKGLTSGIFNYKNEILEQELEGIKFQNPIGLSAGFDYEAKLTQISSSLGFGFETVGTITNIPYEGNPKPMLGRLPRSKSLMVNKGFKNEGAEKIASKLKNLSFEIPIGISIGRSNSAELKTQKESIDDIVKSFKTFEKANIKNSYYELNISCPNLIHSSGIEFYSPKNLKELLEAIEKLKLKKPIFVKLPIEKSNSDFIEILNVISKFSVKGIIIGNLIKDRTEKGFDKLELEKFKVGNFSGKPCEERSNELIELAYRQFGKRFVIIGVGGVFSAEDAYKKIKLGASLVQLITGMIFQGPSLIGEINFELAKLLEKDGYNSVKDAIGKAVNL